MFHMKIEEKNVSKKQKKYKIKLNFCDYDTNDIKIINS